MKGIFSSFVFILSLIPLLHGLANAQNVSQETDTVVSLKKTGNWDNDSLRSLGNQTFNEIWGWVGPDGSEYAIMGSIDSIYFIDISEPEEPKVADVVEGNYPNAIHRDFATYRNYCYAVADEGLRSSLKAFDLQYLPDSVHKVYDSNEFCMNAHNIYQDGGRLYLVSNQTTESSYLLSVLSVTSNPEDPSLLHNLESKDLPSAQGIDNFHDVFAKDNIVYASAARSGFYMIDYQIPDSPFVISAITQYPFKGYNHSSWLTNNGQALVFADENHGNPLKSFDISELKNPTFLDKFGKNYQEGSIPHNPLIKGDYAYVSYYHEGVQVFDISEPGNIKHFKGYDTYPQNDENEYSGFQGCWGVYPFYPSGTIAASDQTNGLFLLEVDTTITHKRKDTFETDPIQFNVGVEPNPFQDKLIFQVENDEKQTIGIELIDPSGKKYFKSEEFLPVGEQAIEISDFGHLAEGVYLLKINSKDGSRVIKVVKGK